MATIFDRIYARSPRWLQTIGINSYGYFWKKRRYGGHFTQYIIDFQNRETYTREEWIQYQNHALRQILRHAVEHVPYYRQNILQPGFSKKDITTFSLDDLKQLPILTKETIRNDPDQFNSEIPEKKVNTYHTSGTTGTPLAIKVSLDGDRKIQAAYEARVRNWAGVDYKMSRAMIGGRLVVPKADSKPPFWRYNIFERQLYMSAFHISSKNTPAYARALNHYQPDYLVGYASSHFFLARFLDELSIEMYQPKAVLTSSEKLTPEMRRTIEKVYHCKVFDAYSGVEACCQASECEFHRMHISPDMGIVEILDDNNDPVPPGTPGRLIATGLINFTQPLIRYDTGDIAVLSDEKCPCGRQMPIIKELVGRLEDTVVTKDGKETVRFHGIFTNLKSVKEGQVIQQDYDRFQVKLVVEKALSEEDKEQIIQRFHQRLGEIDLKFDIVERIERTSQGKFKAVISHVARK